MVFPMMAVKRRAKMSPTSQYNDDMLSARRPSLKFLVSIVGRQVACLQLGSFLRFSGCFSLLLSY